MKKQKLLTLWGLWVAAALTALALTSATFAWFTANREVGTARVSARTGTGSLVTVLTLQGKVSGHDVKVDMTGGQRIIDVMRDGSRATDLYLTGPTNIVAKGEVTDEDLCPAK